MPRKPRHYLPGIPAHIIQRGNNRQACFYTPEDYRFYLTCLSEAADRFDVAIHAYVLMTNHVHLLMTPAHEEGIGHLIQSVGRRYVRYINGLYQRSGTLWEGRHKGSLIDSEHYLLACYRYIELNPVRANMITDPAEYRWSSYRHHAFGEQDPIIRDHALYERLGKTPAERQQAYQLLFKTHVNESQLKHIRETAQSSVPLGNERFREQIEAALGRRVGSGQRGRPRKTEMAV